MSHIRTMNSWCVRHVGCLDRQEAGDHGHVKVPGDSAGGQGGGGLGHCGL